MFATHTIFEDTKLLGLILSTDAIYFTLPAQQ